MSKVYIKTICQVCGRGASIPADALAPVCDSCNEVKEVK